MPRITNAAICEGAIWALVNVDTRLLSTVREMSLHLLLIVVVMPLIQETD
jgi:hypothetical protein